MWKLAIEDDQGHRTVVNLVREEYTVGRAQENTVRLTERNISRHHAVIRRNSTAWVVEDQSSYNGCYVNGVRVVEPRPLETGDLIQLGDYRLEVADESVEVQPTYGSQESTSPSGLQRHSLTGQPDRLVMLVGPNPGAEFPLDGECAVIGRGEECDVSLNHGSVSRIHAEIQALGDGRYEIIDRESANGVRVNGAELQRALLDARDTIELGDIVLKFIPAGMIYRPGADESQQIGAYTAAAEQIAPATALAPEALHRTIFTPGKIAAVIGALVLALILGVVIVGVGGNGDPMTQSGPAEGAPQVLAEAKALLSQGEVEAAHVHVTTGIPETSNARQSAEFAEIEARWADKLFAQANAEDDRERKRELLQQIAGASSVDSERRKRAADMIAALDAGGVDISQLPPAEPSANKTGDASAGAPSSSDEDAGPVEKVTVPTPVRTSKPSPVATSRPPTRSSTPVKDPSKGAMSGNRAAQLSAISAYKAKRAMGTLTDQEARLLRALCRQHGIADCSN